MTPKPNHFFKKKNIVKYFFSQEKYDWKTPALRAKQTFSL
jgi:hypothetical protein